MFLNSIKNIQEYIVLYKKYSVIYCLFISLSLLGACSEEGEKALAEAIGQAAGQALEQAAPVPAPVPAPVNQISARHSSNMNLFERTFHPNNIPSDLSQSILFVRNALSTLPNLDVNRQTVILQEFRQIDGILQTRLNQSGGNTQLIYQIYFNYIQSLLTLINRYNIAIALGENLDGPRISLDSTFINVGQPFGDAFGNAFAQHTMTFFDSLDRPFSVSLDSFIQTSTPSPLSLPRQVLPVWSEESSHPQPLAGQQQLSLWFDTTHTSNLPSHILSSHIQSLGYLSLVPQAVGVGLAVPWDNKTHELRFAVFSEDVIINNTTRNTTNNTPKAYGTALQWTHHHGTASHLSLTSGVVVEDESFLSSEGQGALSTENSRTIFVGLSGRHAFNTQWSLEHSMNVGMTRIQAARLSLLRDFTSVWSSEARVEVVRQDLFREGDRLGFGVHQPLRIEDGRVSVRYVASRTLSRGLVYRDFDADIEPSGRSLSFGVHYYTPLSDTSFVDLSLTVTRQPQHTASRTTDVSAMLFWQRKF